MNKVSDTELKKKSLDILEYIDKLCRDNSIKYSIAYGTLLGAVRHKGFIPWDDDIDIVLLREEYEKLLLLLMKEKKYKLFSFESTAEYRYYYAKLCDPDTRLVSFEKFGEDPELGVFVDIFPLDTLPEDPGEREKFSEKAQILEKEMELVMKKNYARSTKKIHAYTKLVVKFPKHLIFRKRAPYSVRKKIFNRFIQSYNLRESKYVGLFVSPNELFLKTFFDEYEDIVFEDLTVKTIKSKEAMLTATYGDFMKLPPVNMQKTHHPYTVWRIN